MGRNNRAQVTIEFILILVIMLTILAAISLPFINSVGDMAFDTSTAVNLASIQQQIQSTSEEVSLAGCGSYKQITVYIETDPIAEAKLDWAGRQITGSFFELNGDAQSLKTLTLPDYIELSVIDCPRVGYYTVQVKKEGTCTVLDPPHLNPGIGGDYYITECP